MRATGAGMNEIRTERFLVTGQVGASHFPPWIQRHGTKLGLTDLSIAASNTGLRIRATGPKEMLDALGLACSLGPAGVQVDSVLQQPDDNCT